MTVFAMPESDLYQKIGRRIAQVMDEEHVSQVELAKRLNISQATLSRWLSGDIRIPVDMLLEIADILGKPAAWFWGEEISDERLFGWRLSELSPEQRELVLEIAETMRRRRKQA